MTPEQIEKLYLAASQCENGSLVSAWKELTALRKRNEKLEKVVEAAKSWLAVADMYSQHRLASDRTVYKLDYMQGRELFRKILAELEQP